MTEACLGNLCLGDGDLLLMDKTTSQLSIQQAGAEPAANNITLSKAPIKPSPTPPPIYTTSYAVNQGFTYDTNSNLTFWDDKVNNAYDFRATYDGLDRLSLITDSYSGTGEVNYDAMGNITYYKVGPQTLNYTYNSVKQLTAVTGYQAKDFSYDDKGNVISNGENNFVYNAANQMVSSGVGSYVYDGNNKRVKTVDGQGISYSLYAANGKLMYRNVNDVHTDYYYLGNKLVARKKGSAVTYIHTDYLGSPAAETNTAGDVIARMHYQPFGDSIEASKDEVGYTGHKYDKDLGLSYMQARYYDPVIGRFYSNDPIGFRDVHSFNRYAYANNNPFKYTDPDGKASLAFGIDLDLIPGIGGGGQIGLFANFDSETGDLTLGTFSETKVGFGEDAGLSISLQASGGGLSDFEGKTITGEIDVGPFTVEGGVTLNVDESGAIEVAEPVFGLELGVGLPVGASANILTTTIENSVSFNIFETETELKE